MFKISVVDPSATYQITSLHTSADEGTQIVIALQTTGVQYLQPIPYTIAGAGVSLADFVGLTSLSGAFIVQRDGSAQITLQLAADLVAEGTEMFELVLFNGSKISVVINDTSSVSLVGINTVMLLKGDGVNNQNNNVFLDSSSNNHTLTRFGNITQGAFTPFSRPAGQWGVAFDGSGDYLQVPYSVLSPMTDNFTVEMWFVLNTLAHQVLISKDTFGSNIDFSIEILHATTIRVQSTGATTAVTTPITMRPGAWYHVAFVRSGSTNTIYLNGVSCGSNTMSISNNNNPLTIGCASHNNPAVFVNGTISNLRISNVARYLAAFTPLTTPFDTDANTTHLLCTDNRFVNRGSVGGVVDAFDGARVVPCSPFNAVEYNPITMGGSAQFDGNGDYVSLTGQPALSFGDGDFSVEAWIYPTSRANVYHPVIEGRASTTTTPWAFGLRSSGTRYVADFLFGPVSLMSTLLIDINQWVHIACSRQGTTARIFVNGVLSGTTTSSHTLNAATTQYVGALQNGPGHHTEGYMTGIRVMKGIAHYTSNFTPPTTPVGTTPQTSLLLNFTNGGIIDSTGRSVLDTIGNARISTAVVRPSQTSSMSFDGTNSMVSLLNDRTPMFMFGTGDYTIEFWMHYTGPTTGFYNVMFHLTDSNSSRVEIRFSDAGFGQTLQVNTGAGADSSHVIQSTETRTTLRNRWAHVAVARSSGVTRIFVDGVLRGSGTQAYAISGTSRSVFVGRHAAFDWFFQGFLDNIRVTRDQALYTSNFTPPSRL